MYYTAALRILLISFLVLLLNISQTGIVSAGSNVWTSYGPEGGTIYALAIDPQTPSTLYAGTWGGGVFDIQQASQIDLYLPLILRGR
jgi:hypothetical protein